MKKKFALVVIVVCSSIATMACGYLVAVVQVVVIWAYCRDSGRNLLACVIYKTGCYLIPGRVVLRHT